MTEESKSDKFKRLATHRVQNALKQIKLVGNLASPSYEYTGEAVDKIISSLQTALDETKEKFAKKVGTASKFEL